MPLGAIVPDSDLPLSPSAAPAPEPIISGFGMAGGDTRGNPIMAPSGKGMKLGAVVPASDLPPPADPLGQMGNDVAKGLVDVLVPHSPTQAALMIAGGVLPFASEAAEGLGDAAPLISKGLGYLGGSGAGPALARTGVQAGIGAAAGGKEGAVEGAEVGAVGEALPPLASKIAGLGIADNAAAGAMREDAVEAASHKALENELGMTAEQAQKLAKPQELGAGAHELAAAKQAVGQVRRDAIREVGAKYDPIYGPIQDEPVPDTGLSAISKAANDANKWAAQRGARLAPATQKMLNDLEGLAPNQMPVMVMAKGGRAIRLTNEQLAALQAQEDSPLASDPQTIGILRGKLGQAMTMANAPGSSAMDRRVLFDATRPVVDTLNDAIAPEQKPLLQAINNEYAQINRLMPFKGQQKLQAAATLPQLGEAMFSNESAPATKLILSRMNDQQKELARQAFASYVLTDTGSPTETLSKLAANKDTVAELWPQSQFGKINTWRKAMIEQRKFQQGPPNLPSQKAFEQGLIETIKMSGLTPEAQQAATDALIKSGQQQGRFGRYLTSPFVLAAGMGGYGLFHHYPEMVVPAAAYMAGSAGWKALADNPAAMDTYRSMIMSGWTRKGGEMAGRLIVNGVNDAIRGVAPQHPAVGGMEPGPGSAALHASRAEHIAPTPSASDRAERVGSDLAKGKKPPEVHRDLDTGRLSLDEVNRIVTHAANPSATAMLDNVPLSEAMDAAEVANPDERKMMLPLIKQKMMAAFKDQKYNRTLASNLARRYQQLAAGGGNEAV